MAFPLNLLALSQFLCPPHPHPISVAFTVSPFSPSAAFYLYNYCSPFYLSTFISLSLSLPHYHHTVSNTAANLLLPFPVRIFQFLTLVTSSLPRCLVLSSSLPSQLQFSPSSLSTFFPSFSPQSSPPPFLTEFFFFFPHPHQSKWRLPFSILSHTHPISPLEAAARCTLCRCQGTAYHFHYSQRTRENGVCWRRRASARLVRCVSSLND